MDGKHGRTEFTRLYIYSVFLGLCCYFTSHFIPTELFLLSSSTPHPVDSISKLTFNVLHTCKCVFREILVLIVCIHSLLVAYFKHFGVTFYNKICDFYLFWWLTDVDIIGLVQIPPHTCGPYTWQLVYLHDVFPVFGPSVQVDVKTTSVSRTLHYLMGHSYNVVKMQVFTELYFDFQYFAF